MKIPISIGYGTDLDDRDLPAKLTQSADYGRVLALLRLCAPICTVLLTVSTESDLRAAVAMLDHVKVTAFRGPDA